jgi:hypothetical protein
MKLQKRHGRWAALLTLLVGLLQINAAAAANRDADVSKYLTIFTEQTKVEQIAACQSLEWAGLSDPRLFDMVEKNLQTYLTTDNKDDANYAAWLSKALGFSGQDKYRDTLKSVVQKTKQRNLRKYAEQALIMLGDYQKWNPIINDQSRLNASESAENNRLANMLRSGERRLQDLAAIQIVDQQIKSDWLFGLVRDTVQPDITRDWSDDADLRAIRFMLRALAASGKAEYRALVEEAATTAGSSKVRKYAEGYLKQY